MIKEKKDLNVFAKLIFDLIYMLLSLIFSGGLLGIVVAIYGLICTTTTNCDLSITSSLILILLGILWFLSWLEFIKTVIGNKKTLLDKLEDKIYDIFGHTVKYEAPDGPTDTNSYQNKISPQQLNNAVRLINASGISWEKLANFAPKEREQIFAKYFHSPDKAKSANEMFEAEEISPARKSTLNKIIQNSEFQDNNTKNELLSEVKSIDGLMTNEKFQEISQKVKSFVEHKRRVDNHIKYEGRLSNSDIKRIKDVLGYVCMGCGLDPEAKYGKSMKNILEAHHKIPWSEINNNEQRIVSPNDFFILCPNCHKMIHRLDSPDDLSGLKNILNKNDGWWF